MQQRKHVQATLFCVIKAVPLFSERIHPAVRLIGLLDDPAVAAADRVALQHLVVDLPAALVGQNKLVQPECPRQSSR